MTDESFRELVLGLANSTSALAVLGAALDVRLNGNPLPPAAQGPMKETLDAMDVADDLLGLSPHEMRTLIGEIRFTLLSGAKMLFAESRDGRWNYTDKEMLQMGGDVSFIVAHLLKNGIAPQLDGLSQRLDTPGASFLDIGVGVAGLSIEMARLWPQLRIVGIDRWAPSLAIAHNNVQQAGLAERIELREQAAETLPDSEAFDLVWIPSAFISATVIEVILQRARVAMRPGGWVLFAMANPEANSLAASIMKLQTAMWGGCLLDLGETEELLRKSGYVEVRTLSSPPNSLVAMSVGRRPS